jgi:hypothetical protein
MLPEVTAITYVTPLREGGSLPAIMEADDLGTYVVKFRGAGQGPKALVAEVISARLALACGLPVPDLVTVALDPELAAGEPDQEIQDLLRASAGLNLGVDFLSGAVDFDGGCRALPGSLIPRCSEHPRKTGYNATSPHNALPRRRERSTQAARTTRPPETLHPAGTGSFLQQFERDLDDCFVIARRMSEPVRSRAPQWASGRGRPPLATRSRGWR